MAIAQMVQYCVNSLFVASLPGNRYVNGIIFGVGECWAMIFSQILMDRLSDMNTFYTVYGIGLVSYLTLIFFPDSGTLAYIANVMTITSVGGWFNSMLLILELRVPPNSVGSVSALVRTMAVGSSVVAPTIANMPAPWPQVCLLSMATFAMLLTFFLPPPGLHLPKAEKTGDTSAVLIDKQSNALTLLATSFDPGNPKYPITNYALHASSF